MALNAGFVEDEIGFFEDEAFLLFFVLAEAFAEDVDAVELALTAVFDGGEEGG